MEGTSSPPTVTEQTPLHIEAAIQEEESISHLATTAVLRVSALCVCGAGVKPRVLNVLGRCFAAELIPRSQILVHVFIYFVCLCVAWYLWGSQDNLEELALFFHLGPRD